MIGSCHRDREILGGRDMKNLIMVIMVHIALGSSPVDSLLHGWAVGIQSAKSTRTENGIPSKLPGGPLAPALELFLRPHTCLKRPTTRRSRTGFA